MQAVDDVISVCVEGAHKLVVRRVSFELEKGLHLIGEGGEKERGGGKWRGLKGERERREEERGEY